MAEENVNKEVLRIVFLCILWYATSSCNNIIGKTLLNEFPYPLTVTIVQLLSITLYSGPALKCMRIQPRRKADISWSYYKKLILPLALGKFLAVVFSHISLWKVPVSYAHTVKATMPLFTVVLARILIGEKQSMKIYFSLIPIIIGVAIASITEIFFDIIGLLSALAATCAFSLLHIYSKKVLNETGIHHLRLLHLLGKLALILILPIWLLHDASALFLDKSLLTRRDPFDTGILLFLDGLLNWMQNLLAFTILSRVSPVTYAVANASKRISVITFSLILLRNPVTSTNVFGMLLAVLGVLGYNKSKYDDNMSKKRAALVPLSQVISAKPLTQMNILNGKQTPHTLNGFPNGISTYQNGINNRAVSLTLDELSRFLPHPLQTAPFDLNTPLLIPNNINEHSNGQTQYQNKMYMQ